MNTASHVAIYSLSLHDALPISTDSVDFVDEDDARRVLLGLLEHVAHAARADADEHFDEVRPRDREERHIGFAGDGAGEDRKSTRLNSSHVKISYAVFCLKKKIT